MDYIIPQDIEKTLMPVAELLVKEHMRQCLNGKIGLLKEKKSWHERRRGMKIRVIEYTTEIEADARELRESNTLAGNFAQMLSRCFKSNEPFDDEIDEADMRGEEDEVD